MNKCNLCRNRENCLKKFKVTKLEKLDTIKMNEFYDANSPIGGSVLEDKSSIDLDSEIALCDTCENVILQR